jgi:hypothetical protein
LSVAEQLLAAILRSDAAAARAILCANQQDTAYNHLQELLIVNGFARLVLDRLVEFELIGLVPEKHRSNIVGMSMRESVDEEAFRAQFKELLLLLSEYSADLVWIKGAALSLSIYNGGNARASGDFDVVLRPEKFVSVAEAMKRAHFAEIKQPSMCNQLGVGPTDSAGDLTLTPHPQLIPSSVAAFARGNFRPVDIKFGPLDRGVQICEIDRFFSGAVTLEHDGSRFLAPDLVDQLMIALHTFAKDRFKIWKNLLDIHILALELGREPHLWETLVHRCKREAIETDAWAGLILAADRLHAPVPASIFEQLAPSQNLLARLTLFTISPYLAWNATSLPMMILNVAVSSDRKRKLLLLRQTLFPPESFLWQYYHKGMSVPAVTTMLLLVVHWCVLILPGGVVRRTFGPAWWRQQIN